MDKYRVYLFHPTGVQFLFNEYVENVIDYIKETEPRFLGICTIELKEDEFSKLLFELDDYMYDIYRINDDE